MRKKRNPTSGKVGPLQIQKQKVGPLQIQNHQSRPPPNSNRFLVEPQHRPSEELLDFVAERLRGQHGYQRLLLVTQRHGHLGVVDEQFDLHRTGTGVLAQHREQPIQALVEVVGLA